MISICIPTYNDIGNMHNEHYNNITMLNHLLNSINDQTYRDFEVIISDHSKDDSIEKICNEFRDKFDIKFYKFEEKYGSCEANLNNAVSYANRKYIKPMLQDDYFCNPNALEKMLNSISGTEYKWIITGCAHINENNINKVFDFHPPRFTGTKDLLNGINKIGSPIVMMYENCDMTFDEYLIWLMDTEFYFRLYKKFNLPYILNEIMTISRLRADGITNKFITKQLIEEEVCYCNDKHLGILKSMEYYPNMLKRIEKTKLWKK